MIEFSHRVCSRIGRVVVCTLAFHAHRTTGRERSMSECPWRISTEGKLVKWLFSDSIKTPLFECRSSYIFGYIYEQFKVRRFCFWSTGHSRTAFRRNGMW